MSEDYLFDRETVTRNILRLLEAYAMPLAEVEKLTKPWPGCDKGLITVTPDGVEANPSAFWWTKHNPFLVISILTFLGVRLLNKPQIVDWLKGEQHPEGYFRKGKLGYGVAESTYNACVMLKLLGAGQDDVGWDRAKLVQLLQAQQQPGQRRHFAFLHTSDKQCYAEFLLALQCVGSLAALNEVVVDQKAAVHYFQQQQKENGSFKLGWVKQIPYLEESAAVHVVRALMLLEAGLQRPQACISVLQSWQLPDGGFGSIPSQHSQYDKISSFGATFSVLVALYLLGSGPADKTLAERRIVELWLTSSDYPYRRLGDLGHWAGDALPAHALSATHRGLLILAAMNLLRPAPSNLLELILYSM